MSFDCDSKSMTGRSLVHNRNSLLSSGSSNSNRRNVMSLLMRREVCPKTKHIRRKCWGNSSAVKAESERDARQGLISWVEAESLQHLSAEYCPLVPPPRSTIAAAFSSDGRRLASTHGDHTVKIIDCETGNCLKVLSGHRRTPWVVRFHPLHPEIIASGSLDYEVRLWDANTGECIGSRDFYRPIASIAFHAEGELLAVASGHKLYIWHYSKRGEASSPTIVLKTRRSLRAVHFHPHAAPFLLTAEVNDLDSSDSSMTRATSPSYSRYPPPAVFLANVKSNECINVATELPITSLPFIIGSSFPVDDSRINTNRYAASNAMQVESSDPMQPQVPRVDANEAENYHTSMSPMEPSIAIPSISGVPTGFAESISVPAETESHALNSIGEAMETDGMQPTGAYQQINSSGQDNLNCGNGATGGVSECDSFPQHMADFGLNNFHQLRDHLAWQELPFLRGWLLGQRQAGFPVTVHRTVGSLDNSSQHMGSSFLPPYLSTQNIEATESSLAMPRSTILSGVSGRSSLQPQLPTSNSTAPLSGENITTSNVHHDTSQYHSLFNRIQSEIAMSLGATGTAELPCTVKLKVWSHNIEHPCAPLNSERCRLIIPHAVLCSEMGAHFSPCGRYLAACVACVLPPMEGDPGLQTLVPQDTGLATSPTRHPVSSHRVMYELRIYSLEDATFGTVLVSRAIRAAHCLTSIQFSPTSEHILLAYGRRHGSLLKSIVIDGEKTSPVYTVLEVYRVSDMELVSVLPSSEDEVNVACFHPFAGRGLVYGTKEGKLRILRYDGSCANHTATDCHGDFMAEVQTYALEG